MSIEAEIKNNKKLIFESSQNFNLSKGNIAELQTQEWRYFCTDKSKDLNFYVQNWKNYFIKDHANSRGVNQEFVNNKELSKLLSDDRILNVFYFEVWGDVLEHKDPDGIIYRYPQKNYKTLLMPISVPSQDDDIFKTFYNKKLVKLIEGEFLEWDVSNIPHSWIFDYKKVNKLFKLIHIDYIP